MTDRSQQERASGLTRNLSPVNVWALSFGCVIGYGAFTMPGTTFLPMAGPIGTIIALALGACAILVIAANYHFLCSRFPDSGGSFAFTRNLFGYDHAFLCAWALVLAYMSLIWANATAFVAIGRYLFGSILQVGFHYQVAGYDIYLGEVAVTVVVIIVFAVLACGRKRILSTVNTLFAFVLLVGAVICFVAVAAANGLDPASFTPAFAPGEAPGIEVLGIVALVPWAFMGFETVSHAAGECAFPPRRMGGLMAGAILAGLLVYLMMTVMAVAGMPEGYGSWAQYVADLGNLDGTAAMPTLFAAGTFGGGAGTALLAVVILAALTTSMLGFFRATSRLLYVMALDGILPEWFAKLNKNHVPGNAILFIAAVSAFVPLVGRAAIGWATDTTAISAAVAYAYTSVCTLRVAREEGRSGMVAAAVAGIAISAAFLAFPLVPNLWSISALSAESYLIIIVWSVFGLLFFRLVFRRDRAGRFGTSPLVWVFMLFLVLFASTMWVRQVTDAATQQTVEDLRTYYAHEYDEQGIEIDEASELREAAKLQEEANEIEGTLMNSSLFQLALITASLVIMFSVYSLMLKRQREQEAQRAAAEKTSMAKTSFLSNMSHDIRTPMNAIVGYTQLAQRDGVTLEEARDYLGKIDASSKYMLALINDVLEMSRIESGKVELELAEADLREVMDAVRDLFATQMQEKGIDYVVECVDVRDACVRCDRTRLDRMLLNLISNAYKFTSSGGSVSVRLVQLADALEGRGRYELRVKDSGIGMSPEFARRVFDAFERERTSTISGIEGTGLGMAITKSIVDMMGGTIAIETEQGKGAEFIVEVEFELAPEGAGKALGAGEASSAGAEPDAVDFTGKRILVVEDNEINLEIASAILEDMGFTVEAAENGQLAVEMVEKASADHYDAILTDVRMPVMDGYEEARAIRAMPDERKANLPIVAASANAFAEHVAAVYESGMNAHVAKPIDIADLERVLASLLG